MVTADGGYDTWIFHAVTAVLHCFITLCTT